MPELELHNGYPLWRYIPSQPAAIVFVVIFGILTIGHAWKVFRHRMWFCVPFVVGGTFEIIGYTTRAVAYNSTDALMPYVLQSALLLLAPILFAASRYMTLARVIRATKGASFSIIAPVVHGVPWQESLNMLYVTSMLIMIRNIFRVAEYAMGSDGYLLSVECRVYVFDAALMTVTMAWFFWRYPSQLNQAANDLANSEEAELGSRR